jgi:DNA-binding transcriptional ArsR family regulator
VSQSLSLVALSVISISVEESKALGALAALSQATRLSVFRALVRAGPDGLAAGALADLLQVPASTLSAHLKVLDHAGLVSARRHSRHIFYAARYDAARALIAFLMEDCCHGHPAICDAEAAAFMGSAPADDGAG